MLELGGGRGMAPPAMGPATKALMGIDAGRSAKSVMV